MDKASIRSKVRAVKALLTHRERQQAAERVWQLLESTAAFMVADRILLYHSLDDELDTRAFLAKWHGRKHFFLPRVNGVNLDLLPFHPDSLQQGAYRIMEPEGAATVPLEEMELIIVPGVAYDTAGHRVGRGKGFYDRLLADSRATKIGVGYDFQVVDDIDCEPHDVPVDIVITESRFITVRPRR